MVAAFEGHGEPKRVSHIGRFASTQGAPVQALHGPGQGEFAPRQGCMRCRRSRSSPHTEQNAEFASVPLTASLLRAPLNFERRTIC
jgi:hypothetical protein